MNAEEWLQTVDPRSFRSRLLRWFDRHGRTFAWRRTSDPYAVWVSEVMLQQTTTATVAGRFPSFIEQFPTAESLAAATEESVLRAWEGLGYYRRARNLHRASKIVAVDFGGRVPDDPAALRTLPGLGRYSANAIVSFAFDRPLPILEANTVRVWSRVLGAEGAASKQPVLGDLWKVAESLLPKRRPRDFNLALMDLGAMVCTPKNPDCPRCPLKTDCVAFGSGRPERFPTKSQKPVIVEENHVIVVLRHLGRCLIQQRPESGRWAGMWEFPNAKLEGDLAAGQLAEKLAREVGSHKEEPEKIAEIRHGVMHYRIRAAVFVTDLSSRRRSTTNRLHRWVRLDELTNFPLSSAHRRIVAALTKAPVGEESRGPDKS